MSLCPLQTNATPTQPLFAPVGSGGAGGGKTLNVSSINASTITLNANPNDLIGTTLNAPCLNYNLGNGSTTTIYSLYDGIPSTGKPVSALVTNTNNASTQPTVFERPQGLASGSLYLYPEDALLAGAPAVLSGKDGVLSINGVPYNGGAGSTVSTFATASISSLTVSSINGGTPGGATVSTFNNLTTTNLIIPKISTSVFMNIKDARLFDNNSVSTLTFSGSQSGVPSNYVDVAVGRLLVGGLTEAGGNALAGVIDIGPDPGSLSINAASIYMGTTSISSISGRQGIYETTFVAGNGSTISMAQLVSSVIG